MATNWYFKVCLLCCDFTLLFTLVPIKLLHLFAFVIRQESEVHLLSLINVFYKFFSFFIYIRPLVFPFEWFYTSNFYRLLFGISQGSVLKTILWPLMVHFYKLWLGWRVVSLALTFSYTHLSTVAMISGKVGPNSRTDSKQ